MAIAGTDFLEILSPTSPKVRRQELVSGLPAGAPAAHATTHQDGGTDEISVTGLSGLLADAQKVTVRKNGGANVGTQKRLNFIEGAGITLTITNDGGNDEIDITIALA